MEVVGKAFSVEEFRSYVAGVEFTRDWRPSLVVIHHCAAPSLAQRPKGFVQQHMANFEYYYGQRMGWSAGPHAFIDEDEIWVFTPLNKRGVHAVSFNRTGWGLEMLGDFDREDPTSGRGAAVLGTAAAATAILLAKIGKGPDAIRFHRDDPKTDKTCPGRKVTKKMFLELVRDSKPPQAPGSVRRAK